jgi:hypothetical protein
VHIPLVPPERIQPLPAVALSLALVGTLILASCGAAPPSATSSQRPTPQSGISGVTVAEPQCPVQTEGNPCPPRPVSVDIDVQDPTGRHVAGFTSDQDGHFRLPLAPGDYTLLTTNPHKPLLKPQKVTVHAGQFTELHLLLDTGIR